MNKLKTTALITLAAFTTGAFFSCGRKPAPDTHKERLQLYIDYRATGIQIEKNRKKIDSLGKLNEDISGKNAAGLKQESRLPTLIRNKISIDSLSNSNKILEGKRSEMLEKMKQ